MDRDKTPEAVSAAPSRGKLFTETSPGLAEAARDARDQVRDRGLEPIAEAYRRIMHIRPSPTGK